MRVNQVGGIDKALDENFPGRDQKRFDDTRNMDQRYNESTKFGRESGFTPEDAKRQRELRQQLGKGAFQAMFSESLNKYKD